MEQSVKKNDIVCFTGPVNFSNLTVALPKKFTIISSTDKSSQVKQIKIKSLGKYIRNRRLLNATPRERIEYL
jgi:hypothetical protein